MKNIKIWFNLNCFALFSTLSMFISGKEAFVLRFKKYALSAGKLSQKGLPSPSVVRITDCTLYDLKGSNPELNNNYNGLITKGDEKCYEYIH